MKNVILQFVWQKIVLKSRDILMHKIPVYVMLAVAIVAAFGCCKIMCPSPPMNFLAQQYAEADRIVVRADQNAAELEKFEALLFSEDPFDQQKVAELKMAMKDYRKGRDNVVVTLLKYLDLELDECKELYRLMHGELPKDVLKAYAAAKGKVKEGLSKVD